MSKKTLLTIVQYIVFLGLGIGIIYWMFSKMTTEQIDAMFASIKQTRLWMLIPIFFVGFLSHWFRAVRWNLMLEPLDIKPKTSNTFFAVMIGYMTNLVIPRAGEVAKCTVLARYEKVPADKMIGTIVAERAFDVLCLGIITLVTFFLEADVITSLMSSGFGSKQSSSTIYLVLVAGLVLGIVALVVIYVKFKHTAIGKFIKGLAAGITSILKLKRNGMFILMTFLIWGMYWFQIVLGFWCMPFTEHLSINTAFVILVVGSVGVIATPGGIGAYPALVATALSLYNIDMNTHGQAFGWVSWLLQVAVVLLLGALSLVLLPIINRTPHNAQTPVDRE
jgi:uncharacterized protein (TIRG00374 family)